MKKVNNQAKLEPEVDKNFNAMIKEIMIEKGLSEKGEAYPYLIEMYNSQRPGLAPELEDDITAIRYHTDGIIKRAQTMKSTHIASMTDKDQNLENLKGRLEENRNTITALEKELKDMRDKYRSLEKEYEKLKNENSTQFIIDYINQLKGNAPENTSESNYSDENNGDGK